MNRDRRSVAASLAIAGLASLGAVLAACQSAEPPPTAVIVDQLSLTHPNQAFVDSATELLQDAGYEVDYYPGEAATVGLYKQLPALGHDLVLLRTHSARIETDGETTDDVALFTGEMIDLERYSISGVPVPAATAAAEAAQAASATRAAMTGPTPIVSMLSADEVRHVKPVYYAPESGELPHFGLLPEFVEQDLEGAFEDSPAVILMGCDGLRSQRMADAFISRGAGAFVSWDQPVSAEHTDEATEALLRLHLSEGLDLVEALDATMAEVGPDPAYGARLVYVGAE